MLAAVAPAVGQNVVVNNPDNAFFWGVRVSGDVTFPGKWKIATGDKVKMYKAGAGIEAGVVANVPLVANLYLEPGVSLYYDTYKVDNLTVLDGDGSPMTVSPALTMFGMRVPVTVGYRFDIWENASLAVFTGPELSCGLAGRYDMSDSEREALDGGLGDVYGKEGSNNRVDLGWKVGAGLYVGPHWWAGVSGTLGLLDQYKNDVELRNNRLAVTVGYNF